MEGHPFGNGLPARNPRQPGTYTSTSSSRDDPGVHSTAAPAPFDHTHMRVNHPLASQTTRGVQPTYMPSTCPVAAPYYNYLAPPYPSQHVPSGSMPGGYGAHDHYGQNQFNHLGYLGEQANRDTHYQQNQYMNALMRGSEHAFQNDLAGGSWVPPHLHTAPSFPPATTYHHDHERTANISAGDATMEEDDSGEDEGSENDDMEEDASEEDNTEKDIGDPEDSMNRAYDGPHCELCNHHGHVPFDCHLARWDSPLPEPAAHDPIEDIEDTALSENQEKYQRLAGKLSQIVWNLIPDEEQPPESHKTMMKHLLRVLSDQPDNPEIVHNHVYGEEFQDKWLCIKAMCDPEYQGVVSLVDGRCRYCRNPRRSETVTLCYQIMPRKGRTALYREVGIVRA